MQSVILQIVAAEMLEAGARAVLLQPADVRLSHLPREKRILREILEVPPAQRRALDVDARRKQNVHALFKAVVRERGAHLTGAVPVPGVGKQLYGGVRDSGIGSLRAVRGARFYDAQPNGPVRHGDLRDLPAEVHGVPEIFTANEPQFFFCGEFFDIHILSLLKNRA